MRFEGEGTQPTTTHPVQVAGNGRGHGHTVGLGLIQDAASQVGANQVRKKLDFLCIRKKNELTPQPPSPNSQPQAAKSGKSFGEWLMSKALKDSAATGAGFEGELKDGRYKGKKK